MYSGLKACHEKNNQPFDINTEIETIQKQINYDINHLNDGFIKRVLNVFIHLISNPDNLELTLNRYSSTTEQIIAKTKRNGLNEFEINDLKIIFNRQDDNESVLTVNHKDISHSCNVKTAQLQQFIKIMEQKAQLPIYIDKNNLKETRTNNPGSDFRQNTQQQQCGDHANRPLNFRCHMGHQNGKGLHYPCGEVDFITRNDHRNRQTANRAYSLSAFSLLILICP